VTPAAEATALL
jgi:hypothetical protein